MVVNDLTVAFKEMSFVPSSFKSFIRSLRSWFWGEKTLMADTLHRELQLDPSRLRFVFSLRLVRILWGDLRRALSSIDPTFSGTTNGLMFQLMCLSLRLMQQGCFPLFNVRPPLDELIPPISMFVGTTLTVVCVWCAVNASPACWSSNQCSR